jgi:hypothetical protein
MTEGKRGGKKRAKRTHDYAHAPEVGSHGITLVVETGLEDA